MNKTIQQKIDNVYDESRKEILDMLQRVSELGRQNFRLMYGRKNGKRSVEDALKMDLSQVLSEVTNEQISHLYTQCEASLNKLP